MKHPLPVEAQFAPVNAIIAEDLDGDVHKDLLVAGNEYQSDVMIGDNMRPMDWYLNELPIENSYQRH